MSGFADNPYEDCQEQHHKQIEGDYLHEAEQKHKGRECAAAPEKRADHGIQFFFCLLRCHFARGDGAVIELRHITGEVHRDPGIGSEGTHGDVIEKENIFPVGRAVFQLHIVGTQSRRRAIGILPDKVGVFRGEV